ncbi:MAG TPA: hypothetical protein VFP53_08550 [Sphingomicrobium sp.]|nr:hypothetical protein [Sphingomicrobium sp.]
MKNLAMFLGGIALAITGATGAEAKLDKPINASTAGHATGCTIHDANGVESFDPSCQTFSTVKLDQDGNVQHYIYHDDARLQAGQTAPESAVTTPVSYVIFGLSCTGTERITPSGYYSSNQVCTPL